MEDDGDDDDVRRLLFGKLYILINLHNEVMNNDCAKWLKNMRFIECTPQKKKPQIAKQCIIRQFQSILTCVKMTRRARKKWSRNELLMRCVNCTLIIKMVWIFATEANVCSGSVRWEKNMKEFQQHKWHQFCHLEREYKLSCERSFADYSWRL